MEVRIFGICWFCNKKVSDLFIVNFNHLDIDFIVYAVLPYILDLE